MASPFPQITSPPQAQAEVVVNESLDTLGHQAVYGKNPATTTGLVWGYYGGRWGGFAITAGTLTLDASTTVYGVVAIATGLFSKSISITNWNDATNYLRVYKWTTTASAVTAVEDYRVGPGGVHGSGGGSSGPMGDALVADPLSQFASTTSAQLRGVLSDETGTGAAVFADSPALAGTPTVPTASAGTNTLQIASTAFVKSATDAAVAGLSWKQAVRVATVSAGTLASSFENNDILDGVNLTTGDRILVKNQTAGAENGIYVVNASGAPTRATDADSGAELVNASVYVSEGTLADTQWTCTTNAQITVGTTSLAFAQLASGGGGGGLTNFTDSLGNSVPNATVTVATLAATGAATNMDVAIVAKGTGAILAQVPDNTSTGGNKRGTNAVDFQKTRSVNDQVAGGPSGAIVGGINNKIDTLTSYAFIGGGLGNSVNAGGALSPFIGGGSSNSITSTSNYNAIVGGNSNSITGGIQGAILGGTINTITAGSYGVVLGGKENSISGIAAMASGLQAKDRGVQGAYVFAASQIGVKGDSQGERYNLGILTNFSATVVPLTADGLTASGTNQPKLATTGAMAFTGRVIAKSSANTAGWYISGVIQSLAGTVSLVGTPTVTLMGATAGAAAWAVTVTADNTNKCLKVTAAGDAGSQVYWSCVVDVAYAQN